MNHPEGGVTSHTEGNSNGGMRWRLHPVVSG